VSLSDSVTVTGSAAFDGGIALSASTTNQLVTMAYLTATIKGVYIKSDVALTIKVDSTGAPEQTIAIAAGVPYTWYTGRPDTCLLASDVSLGWYLTCTLAANVYIRVLN
jgi:hypothetical protein